MSIFSVASNTSCVLKSELDIFLNTPTQVGVQNSRIECFYPISTLSDGPLEFVVSGSGESYVDPTHTYLEYKFKVSKNGTPLLPSDNVAPINYVLNTAFSQFELRLNDKLVNNPDAYSYRAALEALLFTSEEIQSTFLQAGFFYRDTANTHDTVKKSENNWGFNKRGAICQENGEVSVFGALHYDLGSQPKLLLNGVDLRFKLHRTKNDFVLLSESNEYKFEITHACLYIRKVALSPSVQLAHESALSKAPAKYPINRVQVKSTTIAQGVSSKILPNLYLGQLPQRLIIALVSNKAYNGDYKSNPFKFQHYNLSKIQCKSDGTSYPSNALNPNFAKNIISREYASLFTDLGALHSRKPININLEQFVGGETFFAFDLTPDFSASDNHKSVTKNSNLSLELVFAKPLPETINVLAFAEFRNTIEISKTREVFTDY